MKREWKPGDVALVVEEGRDAALAIRTLSDTWQSAFGQSGRRHIVLERPLAVIDPEDREQVERVADLVTQQVSDKDRSDQITDALVGALREFANPTPPKPEEPTGLGAVVEDVDGRRWVRTGDTGTDDWREAGFRSGKTGRWHTYSSLSAVRVLSEGVIA